MRVVTWKVQLAKTGYQTEELHIAASDAEVAARKARAHARRLRNQGPDDRVYWSSRWVYSVEFMTSTVA